jgi:DNA-directed RNA polymerase II subunit RPB1
MIDEGPKTIGLHMSVTSPQNADFDGDEMNLHVPQGPEEEAELRYLMGATECMMSGQSNANAMGVVYNPTTDSYLLTQDGVYVDPYVLYDAISMLTSTTFNMIDWQERVLKYNLPLFSGKAFYSILFPSDFFYKKGDVVIKHGVLIKGVITKDHIGATGGSVIQDLWHQYGKYRAAEFITDSNWVIDKWLSGYGFSVGMIDCNPKDKKQKRLIQKEIEKAKLAVESMTGMPMDDPFENERRERQIIQEIDSVKNIGDVILEDGIQTSNAMAQMINAKTKGKKSNYIQIAGFVGQQFLRGKRMEKGLAYYDAEDPEYMLEAQGFIKNSFLSGMTPGEMFFHQAAGREGLINTGLTTAQTGEIQRKIIKSTEDITVWADGTVRNTTGTIFQFVYGGDGLDPARLVQIKVRGEKKLWYMNVESEVEKLNAKYGY